MAGVSMISTANTTSKTAPQARVALPVDVGADREVEGLGVGGGLDEVERHRVVGGRADRAGNVGGAERQEVGDDGVARAHEVVEVDAQAEADLVAQAESELIDPVGRVDVIRLDVLVRGARHGLIGVGTPICGRDERVEARRGVARQQLLVERERAGGLGRRRGVADVVDPCRPERRGSVSSRRSTTTVLVKASPLAVGSPSLSPPS